MVLFNKIAPAWGHMFYIDLLTENIKKIFFSEITRPGALKFVQIMALVPARPGGHQDCGQFTIDISFRQSQVSDPGPVGPLVY